MLLAAFWLVSPYFKEKNNTPANSSVPNLKENQVVQENDPVPAENKTSGFSAPLDGAGERATKKPFGIFITPQNSPVSPEKFRGYHTGTDFEIFSGEENVDVPVQAVCDGNLLLKKSATGYGGVAVESCNLNEESITVVYGHLKLSSVSFNSGEKINAGDTLGILGRGYSAETSGERKHLHLGFHKGGGVNILGYVQNQAALAGWLDPCQFVCGNL